MFIAINLFDIITSLHASASPRSSSSSLTQKGFVPAALKTKLHRTTAERRALHPVTKGKSAA